MVDFERLMLKRMTPEQQKQYFEEMALWQAQCEEYSRLDNQELAEKLDTYLYNSQRNMVKRGQGTYDSVLWWVLIPLLVHRLRMDIRRDLIAPMPKEKE